MQVNQSATLQKLYDVIVRSDYAVVVKEGMYVYMYACMYISLCMKKLICNIHECSIGSTGSTGYYQIKCVL